MAAGCLLLHQSARTEPLEPEKLFSLKSQVFAVVVSPDDDLAAVVGVYDETPVLIEFNHATGVSKIVGHLADIEAFYPVFSADGSLSVVNVRLYNSPSGIVYPRYYSPLVVNQSEDKSRFVFRSDNDVASWPNERQPLLGLSDDRKQFYLWAYSKERGGKFSGDKSVVAASSPDTNVPIIVADIRAPADTVFVDANGSPVASVKHHESGHVTHIWHHHGDSDNLIHGEEGDATRVFVFGLTPDREALVVELQTDSSDWQCCYEMRLSDGSISGAIFQRDGKLVDFLVVDERGVAVAVSFDGPYPNYEFHDSNLTQWVQEIQALYPGSAVHIMDFHADEKVFVAYVTGVHGAGDFLKFSADSLEPVLLARNAPEISTEYLSLTEVVDFKAEDGTSLQALLTMRKDVRKRGSAPLIVIPSDIAWREAEIGFDPLVQYLAYRGYAVLEQRARRRTLDFAAGDLEQYMTWLWQDLEYGIQPLIEAGIIDPERVCIIGRAHGAHTAFSAAAFSSFPYKCIVSIDGILDLGARYKSLIPRKRTVSGVFKRLVTPFGEAGRRIKGLSPLRNTDKIDSAVLLINGDDSPSESVGQSRRMYVRLVADGKDARWFDIKDEDGTWYDSESVRQLFIAIDRFVNPRLSRKMLDPE